MTDRFIMIPWRERMHDWPDQRWLIVNKLRLIAHENVLRDKPVLVSKRQLTDMAGDGIGRNTLRDWIAEAGIELVRQSNKGFEPIDISRYKPKRSRTVPKVEKPEKPDFQDQIEAFEAIYQPLPGAVWHKPGKSAHWTAAHRKAVAKRLEKNCLANQEWSRFLAVTKSFLASIRNGSYPANLMYEPPYWMHKARNGASVQPDDTWLYYEGTKSVAEPEPCNRCGGLGRITAPNTNGIGIMRIECPECRHA